MEPPPPIRHALWRKCNNAGLALWSDRLDSLNALCETRTRWLASHLVGVFILEPGSAGLLRFWHLGVESGWRTPGRCGRTGRASARSAEVGDGPPGSRHGERARGLEVPGVHPVRDDPEVAHDLGGQHSLVLLTGDQGGAGGVAVLEELAQVAPIVAVSDVPARL